MESALPSTSSDLPDQYRPLAISNLLLFVAALVFAMVVVGGITRLTESGLSITEWKPVSGALPPLTDARLGPRLRAVPADPGISRDQRPRRHDLAAFKQIYFWEWLHRLLGRRHRPGLRRCRWLVRAEARHSARLRLEDGRPARARRAAGRARLVHGRVRASPIAPTSATSAVRASAARAGDLRRADLDRARLAPPRRHGRGRSVAADRSLSFTVLAVLSYRCFTVPGSPGLNAGQVANSWPLMNGRLFPAGVDWSHGVGWALANDPYLVHFVHRWWAWVAVVALVIFARRVRIRAGADVPLRSRSTRRSAPRSCSALPPS